MTKVFIATPAYDGKVYVPYAVSLGTTILQLAAANINVHLCVKTSGSLLVLERNSLIQNFWESDCTHMLCIDSDLGWDAYSIKRLLDLNEDFIGGVYPSRMRNEFIFRPKSAEDGLIYKNENGLIEMEYIPAGFILLTKNAIEKMRKKHYNLAYDPKVPTENSHKGFAFFNTEVWNGEFWGEDYYFCRKVREAGIKIWVDPYLKFDHAGKVGSLAEAMTAQDQVTSENLQGTEGS